MASGHLALSVRYTVASRPDGRLEAGRGARSGPERPRSGVLGPDLALEGQIRVWRARSGPGGSDPGLAGQIWPWRARSGGPRACLALGWTAGAWPRRAWARSLVPGDRRLTFLEPPGAPKPFWTFSVQNGPQHRFAGAPAPQRGRSHPVALKPWPRAMA